MVFGFLKKMSDTQWDFEYLDEKRVFMKHHVYLKIIFIDLLIKNITPKIIENGNSLLKIALITKKSLVQAENEKNALELGISKCSKRK